MKYLITIVLMICVIANTSYSIEHYALSNEFTLDTRDASRIPMEHSALSNEFTLDTRDIPRIPMEHSALSNVFTLNTMDYSVEIFYIDALPQNLNMFAKAKDLRVMAVIENKNQSVESKMDFECFAVSKDSTRTDIESKSVTLKSGEKSVLEFYTDKLPRIFEGTIRVRAKSANSIEASQEVDIYYTPFKFGKDNYSFANDIAYTQNFSIKDVVNSLCASLTSTTEVSLISPIFYYFIGSLMTFLSEP